MFISNKAQPISRMDKDLCFKMERNHLDMPAVAAVETISFVASFQAVAHVLQLP